MSTQSPINRQRQHGFTLIEMLIVIGVIGILVGLLLPAVQAAREAARRTSCQSNLMQLSLATQAYHSSYEVYPAGTIGYFSPVKDFPGDYHHNWLLRIMPFVGQDKLVRDVDSDKSVYDPANRAVSRFSDEWSTVFRCPSDPMTSDILGVTNYAGVYSGKAEPISETSDGPFTLNLFRRSKDIGDGLANTLFIGERHVLPFIDLGWTSGTHATLRTTGKPIRQTEFSRRLWTLGEEIRNAYGWYSGDFSQSYNELEGLDIASLPRAWEDTSHYPGLQSDSGMEDFEGFGSTKAQPKKTNGVVKTYLPLPTAPLLAIKKHPDLDVTCFGSFHGIGANFVFGDGHVQTISKFVDATVYSQMGNCDDRGPLSRN